METVLKYPYNASDRALLNIIVEFGGTYFSLR